MLRVSTTLAGVVGHNKRALWRETGRRSQRIMGVEDKGAPAPGAGGDQCPRRRRAVAPGRRVRLPAHRHREAGNAPPTPLATFVLRRAHIALIRSFTPPSCFPFHPYAVWTCPHLLARRPPTDRARPPLSRRVELANHSRLPCRNPQAAPRHPPAAARSDRLLKLQALDSRL